jgi:hypothetical protein
MKRVLLVLVCAAALTGLTGCNDYTTPQGIVGTAYKALSKDNVKTFKRTLTGDALARYGNLAGMVDLQKRFAGRELKAGETVLTATEKDSRGWDKVRRYSVEVMSRAIGREGDRFERETGAGVVCSVRFQRKRDFDDYPHRHFPGRGGYYPMDMEMYFSSRGENPPSAWYDERTWCWISSIQ